MEGEGAVGVVGSWALVGEVVLEIEVEVEVEGDVWRGFKSRVCWVGVCIADD